MEKKIIDFLETWGRLLGAFAMIIYQAIANASIINPDFRLATLPTSENARLIIWCLIIILMAWEILKLRSKIISFENNRPILKIYQLPEFSVLRVPPRNKLSTTSANPIVARMKFYNQPVRMSDNSIAKKVAIQLTAYDINWKPIFNPLNGIWSNEDDVMDVLNLKEGSKQVDFEPNGLPHELALIMKYREDQNCYVICNEIFAFGDLMYPHVEINREEFYLRIRLIPTNADAVEFYFLVKNHGIDAVFEMEEYQRDARHEKQSKKTTASLQLNRESMDEEMI